MTDPSRIIPWCDERFVPPRESVARILERSDT
jgi:hypothetical protein